MTLQFRTCVTALLLMLLLTAGHIGVWVRACEESEDEGEVSHLLIIIMIITIIIIIISSNIILVTSDLVHSGHDEPEEKHQPALRGAGLVIRHHHPGTRKSMDWHWQIIRNMFDYPIPNCPKKFQEFRPMLVETCKHIDWG